VYAQKTESRSSWQCVVLVRVEGTVDECCSCMSRWAEGGMKREMVVVVVCVNAGDGVRGAAPMPIHVQGTASTTRGWRNGYAAGG